MISGGVPGDGVPNLAPPADVSLALDARWGPVWDAHQLPPRPRLPTPPPPVLHQRWGAADSRTTTPPSGKHEMVIFFLGVICFEQSYNSRPHLHPHKKIGVVSFCLVLKMDHIYVV